jgi:hypothetical protein
MYLAIKSKLAMTDTDYRTDTREEQHTGDYANFLGICLIIIQIKQKLLNPWIDSRDKSTISANKEVSVLEIGY